HANLGDYDLTDRLDFHYDGHPTLSWAPKAGATAYALWRQTPDGTWQLAAWTTGTSFSMDGAIHPGERFKLTYSTGTTLKDGMARDGTEAPMVPGWQADHAFTVPAFGANAVSPASPLAVL